MKADVKDFKRELIVAAACELFYARGYEKSTIDALAEALSVSKTLIYQHFPSKLDILETICLRGIDRAVDVATEVARNRRAPQASLETLVRGLVRVCVENQKHLAVCWREMNLLPEETRREILDKQKKFDRVTMDVLRAGVEAGVFHVADHHMVSLAISGMIIWMQTWFSEKGKMSFDRVADGMVEAALRMAGAPPNRPAE